MKKNAFSLANVTVGSLSFKLGWKKINLEII